jgi:hypothetical protein
MGLCRVILQDARTRRSLIPFLLLQPISRTREQSPPLGDIPSALRAGRTGAKNGTQRERDTPMYIRTSTFSLFRSALCAPPENLYTKLSRVIFWSSAEQLNAFLLDLYPAKPSHLRHLSLARLVLASDPFLRANNFARYRPATGGRHVAPLVPSAAKHECRSRGAKLFLPFRLLFCSEVCKCFAASSVERASDNKPHLSRQQAHYPHTLTDTTLTESSRFTSCRQGILALSLDAGSARGYRSSSEMLLLGGFAPAARQTRRAIAAATRFSTLILLFGNGKVPLSIKLSPLHLFSADAWQQGPAAAGDLCFCIDA